MAGHYSRNAEAHSLHLPQGSCNAYFNSIDSKVSNYKNLEDAPTMLELTIWKSKIAKRCGPNNDLLASEVKVQCRTDSVTMVIIIIHNVLAFLELIEVTA
jgi:hypothetical protein